jgi:hypothetical protein
VPTTQELLAAVSELAGDGFVRRDVLQQRFPRVGSREFRRALGRAVNGGFLISRRTGGSAHLAIASEGWAILREGD